MTNFQCEVQDAGPYGAVHIYYHKYTVRDGTAPIAVVHHAHQSSAYQLRFNSPGMRSVVDYLSMVGYVVVVGDFGAAGHNPNGFGAAQWGNDDNQQGINSAKNFGVSYGGSSTKKLFLVGLSMGACATLSYAGRYPANVAGVLGILPAIDISAYKNAAANGLPESFRTTIDAAYGGSYSNATDGPTHNPRVMADTGVYTMPIQLWWGYEDVYAPYHLVSAFYAAVKSANAGAPITINRVPGLSVEHADAPAGDVPKSVIASFALSCVS